MKHFAGFAICPFLLFFWIRPLHLGSWKDDSLPVLVRFFREDIFDKACWCRLAHWNDAEDEGQFVENMFLFEKRNVRLVHPMWARDIAWRIGKKTLRNPGRVPSFLGFTYTVYPLDSGFHHSRWDEWTFVNIFWEIFLHFSSNSRKENI